MKEALLLGCTALLFLVGFFAVQKLSSIMEQGRKGEMKKEEGKNSLRIAFSNPLVIEAMTEGMDRFSKAYPGIQLYLLGGDNETVWHGLESGSADIAFLPENAQNDRVLKDYHVKQVLLRQGKLLPAHLSLPVEPLKQGELRQRAVWKKNSGTFADIFMKYCSVPSQKAAG